MGEKHRVKRKVLRDTYKNGRTYGYVGETPTKTARSPTKTGEPRKQCITVGLAIENGVSGYLVDNDSAVIEKCCAQVEVSKNAHKRVVEGFTWKSTAIVMGKVIGVT